jgi:rfaE bifunctional protein nucleotidyltransferase chain/domain
MEAIEVVRKKIVDWIEIERVSAREKFFKRKIVFTNGCFDILHQGHIEYLSKASDLGDILIVGLNSDSSVKKIKGSSRPVQDQDSRSLILASLFFVDFVVLFDEETPLQLIQTVKPDILVKGGDYKEVEKIVGYDEVTGHGGKVITLPFVEGYSSTEIMQKIINL